MNWEAIGAVGEMLGASGVVITLAYLAVQLKQNTRTVRSNSATAHTQAGQAHLTALTQNAEVNKLFWSGLSNRAGVTQVSIRPGLNREPRGRVSDSPTIPASGSERRNQCPGLACGSTRGRPWCASRTPSS